jgi:hypothetical protein
MKRILRLKLLVLFLCVPVFAQTTVFTYQGRLTDAAMPGTASYLMEFKLFAQASGGVAIETLSDVPVSVANNIFTVQLNFTAANAFDGADRFLDISVKRTAGDTYTQLMPRQPITSAPYAIRARDTATLGGMGSGSFVLKSGDTMKGDLNMGNNKVTGLGTPTAATDAATKAYVDAAVTPRFAQVSWAFPSTHGAGVWSNIGASILPFTTTGKPLLITMNLSLNGGSHGTCRPMIDGVWAGTYGGLPNPGDPFWQEGLIGVGVVGGAWARWNLSRIYPAVPAGSHTFQVQCATDGGTMQSCGTTIACSFGVIELH